MARQPLRFLALVAASLFWLPLALGSRLLHLCGGARPALRLAAAGQRRWARSLLAVLSVEVVRTGAAEAGPCLIVANHLSYLDILVLASLFPGRFVAKSDIAGWPVLGTLAATVGTIFLDQGRGRDLVRVEREMARTLAAGVPVLLFPEGHSTRGLVVDRLHSSLLECAVRAGIPCRAVTLRYETPRDPWAPAATICWWGGMTFGRHAWGVLGLRRVRAEVCVAGEARRSNDRKALAAELHADLTAGFRPLRQGPIAPDYPWPELFRADALAVDGVPEGS
jgi:1-acyl-sn-glycerol-3-phosphate acyltransferase